MWVKFKSLRARLRFSFSPEEEVACGCSWGGTVILGVCSFFASNSLVGESNLLQPFSWSSLLPSPGHLSSTDWHTGGRQSCDSGVEDRFYFPYSHFLFCMAMQSQDTNQPIGMECGFMVRTGAQGSQVLFMTLPLNHLHICASVYPSIKCIYYCIINPQEC